MGVLKFRPNANSPWSEIPALVGAQGKDGYTPVKGTDYWTAADKSEIITDLKNDETFYPKMTIVTLTAIGWSNNTQTVTVNGILADETQQAIFINPVYNIANVETILNCNIYASAQGENSITFSADTTPTTDVQFNIKWEIANYV